MGHFIFGNTKDLHQSLTPKYQFNS